MGVTAATPVIPDEGVCTWDGAADTFSLRWDDAYATWDGWTPRGGRLAAADPARASVAAADVSR